MRNVIACLLFWALPAFAAVDTARAVCFYPNTLVSGYTESLNDEIKATPLIIVGKVTAQQYIQADPTDPDGITAYIYRVQVLKVLKGTAPRAVYVRAENDSGGYRMNLGEEDLLFLMESGGFFEADDCGNSSQLPRGQAVLGRVEAAVRTTGHARLNAEPDGFWVLWQRSDIIKGPLTSPAPPEPMAAFSLKEACEQEARHSAAMHGAKAGTTEYVRINPSGESRIRYTCLPSEINVRQ